MNRRILFLVLASGLGWGVAAPAQQTAFRKFGNLVFAEVDGRELLLDLYLPQASKPPPLIVYVHGGAWRTGSKDSMRLTALPGEGYAIASVDYRLTPEAPFPAQVHDIKAAIQFLRGNQNRYLYDGRKVAIAGSSAGGHLAALVGVTNHSAELEGFVGAHLDESSEVHAIVAYFGASNLLTILHQSTPRGLSVRKPALRLLLGGQPEQQRQLAMLASPVFHVDRSDPPLLLLHGDQDQQMPINQSHEPHSKFKT